MRPAASSLPEALERVVALAREIAFRTSVVPTHSLSLVELVRESGYLQFRDQIDPAALRAVLKGRTEIVEAWLQYSKDKEANWGWFFERERRPGYAVGLRTGFSPETRCEISDRWEACAYYIKHEFEAILGAPRHGSEPPHPAKAEGTRR